jgi:hypothetical protein
VIEGLMQTSGGASCVLLIYEREELEVNSCAKEELHSQSRASNYSSRNKNNAFYQPFSAFERGKKFFIPAHIRTWIIGKYQFLVFTCFGMKDSRMAVAKLIRHESLNASLSNGSYR